MVSLTIISLLSCVLVYAEASGVAEEGKKSEPATTETQLNSPTTVREGLADEPNGASNRVGESADATTVAADAPGTAVDGERDGVSGSNELPEKGLAVPEKTPAAASTKSSPEPIAMESDQATIDREKRIIELVGNVKISQGTTVISANRLNLLLKEGAKLETPSKSGENSIEKVVAIGDVKFQLDIGTAYSDHAEYHTGTKLLVLTGKEPKFISGENTITGSKIIVNRESGMVKFEGGAKSRVEAVIYSNEQL